MTSHKTVKTKAEKCCFGMRHWDLITRIHVCMLCFISARLGTPLASAKTKLPKWFTKTIRGLSAKNLRADLYCSATPRESLLLPVDLNQKSLLSRRWPMWVIHLFRSRFWGVHRLIPYFCPFWPNFSSVYNDNKLITSCRGEESAQEIFAKGTWNLIKKTSKNIQDNKYQEKWRFRILYWIPTRKKRAART